MNFSKVVATVGLVLCLIVILIAVADGGRCKYIPHCDDCTYNPDTRRATCFTCDKLFGLCTENGFSKCKNCSENEGCLLCKDFTKCDLCRYRARDGPDMNGKATCSACAPSCKSCATSGSGKCDICKIGSKKVGDTCRTCDVEHCSYCDSTFTQCSACQSGYFLENNKCTACTPGCSLCKDRDRCSVCKSKFFLEDDGTCVGCIANCNDCDDHKTCISCNMGFFLNDMKTCDPCDDSCLVCSSKDTCSYCKEGKPVGGSCKCADDCESCKNAGYGKCDSCRMGFTQSEGKGCKKIKEILN